VLELLGLPFLACLVLTGIHAYLGLHVLARGVIFVDLALAQVAALGISVAFLAGHPIQSQAAYWYALTFTLGGAALFAITRTRRLPVPQEAVIGIVYAVSASAAVLVVDRAPQGAEHIKELLVGSVLTVTAADVRALAVLYAAVGALHWLVRRPLLEISLAPDTARAAARRQAAWDFVFYATFGIVVTSSVRLAGVLLVFSYLIVPATVGALLARSVGRRLAIGWAFGAVVSALGLVASFVGDLPTGAAIVSTFGLALLLVALALAGVRLGSRLRAEGIGALRAATAATCAIAAVLGLLLLAFPRMDHHWLDGLEAVAPWVQTAFLTAPERGVRADSEEALRRGRAELERLRALQRDVQWGTRALDDTQQERLRQFLAGRAEISAGDRMVLRTLRGRARERQRLWLGVPLLVAGAAAAWWLATRARAGAAALSPGSV
jgi:zinc/manganese transport system permease protein